MKSGNNGLRGILDVMLPPRQDMRDEQGNPIRSKVTGGKTRSDFRDQRTGRFHGGLDINYGGPKNSAGNPPVYSPIEGTFVGYNTDNNTIVIRDKSGINHEFMHFDKTAQFEQGQEVKIGDQLGTMGNTSKGVQNGAYHVHYEMSVEVNGAKYLIDPEAYHNGVPMDQMPMMDAKKQGIVDPKSVPELQDWAHQEQERREAARREREQREAGKIPLPPQPGDSQGKEPGAWDGQQPRDDAGSGGLGETSEGGMPQREAAARAASTRPGRTVPFRPDHGPGQGPEQPMPHVPDASGEHPGAPFIREEREMLRTPPRAVPYGTDAAARQAGRPFAPLMEQPWLRPRNPVLDPLPPEDDPDGADREAWERWRRGENVQGSFEPVGAARPPLDPESVEPRRQRPPGYVAAFPELDEGSGRPPSCSPSLPSPGDSKAMSTLDFIKETFRLAAEGVPETPRPKRPAWFKPSNPEELTTEEHIWEIFNPKAAQKYGR